MTDSPGVEEPAPTAAYTAAGAGQGVARALPLALARLTLALGLKKVWVLATIKKVLVPFFSISVRRFRPQRGLQAWTVLKARHPTVVGQWSLLRHEFNRSGWTGTLAHVSTPLGINVVVSMLMFTSFKVALEGLARFRGAVPTATWDLENYQLNHIGVAGAVSGTVQALLTCPTDQVKLRLMNKRQDGDKVCFRSAFRQILSEEGMRGLFRGLPLMALKEAVGIAAFFGVYEAGRRSALATFHAGLAEHQPQEAAVPADTAEGLSAAERRWCSLLAVVWGGGCAGVAYRLCTHPLENVVAYQHRQHQPLALRSFLTTVPARKWAPLMVRGLHNALRGVMSPAILAFVLLEALD